MQITAARHAIKTDCGVGVAAVSKPAVVFWLWLVIVPARVTILCPEECRCGTGGYRVDCYGPSLNSVSLNHPTNIRVLKLNYNNVTLFKRDSFVSLIELEGLHEEWCGLRTIYLGAFNGLTKLTKLYVKFNRISEIIPGTFENKSNLKYHDLRHNKLKHLDSDVFSGLVNLERIYLAENKLKYLHPDTFLGLPNIQHVILGKNPGLQIKLTVISSIHILCHILVHHSAM